MPNIKKIKSYIYIYTYISCPMFSASNVPHRNRNRLRNSSEDPGRVWLAKPLCASCVCICAIRTIQSGHWQWQIAKPLCASCICTKHTIQSRWYDWQSANHFATYASVQWAFLSKDPGPVWLVNHFVHFQVYCAQNICVYSCTLFLMCISKCVVCLDGTTAWRHCWCLLAPPWWCHRPRQRN